MGFFTHRPFGRAAALTLAAAMLLGTPSALAAQVPVELLGQENSISAPGVALVRSGKCGEAVNWGLGADNVLYIYGSGPMNDFSTNEGSRAPWAEELLAASPDGLSTIQAVQVCEGVTKLGAFAFNNAGSAYYTGLTSITLPDSLQEVGRRALYGCKALSSIEVSAANPCLTVQDSAHPLPRRRRSDGLYHSGQRDRAGRRCLCILHLAGEHRAPGGDDQHCRQCL